MALNTRFLICFIVRYQDDHNRAWFAISAMSRWLGIRLDVICVTFASFVVYIAIITQSEAGKIETTQMTS